MKRVFPLLFVFAIALPASAGTYTVTNTADSGPGSLRQAVSDANGHAGADTIVFDTAGVFSVPRTIDFQIAGMAITDALTISAPAAAGQRVSLRSTNNRDTLFEVRAGNDTVTLRHLTTPISPPSGPLMSFLNGLHPKANSLAMKMLPIRRRPPIATLIVRHPQPTMVAASSTRRLAAKRNNVTG